MANRTTLLPPLKSVIRDLRRSGNHDAADWLVRLRERSCTSSDTAPASDAYAEDLRALALRYLGPCELHFAQDGWYQLDVHGVTIHAPTLLSAIQQGRRVVGGHAAARVRRGRKVACRKHCRGCHNDYYNSGAGLHGVCWSLETAQLKTRYEIGTWTSPKLPGAFAKVRVPNCYHKRGVCYYDTLPDFVNPKSVIRHAAARTRLEVKS